MTRPWGFVSSAVFEDAGEPASITAAASSTASGSSFARKAGLPPISVSVPDSSSAPATRRTCWPRAVSPNTSRSSRPSNVSPPTSAMVSANLRLRVHFWSMREAPPYNAAQPDRDTAADIDRRQNQQHGLRPVNDPVNNHAHHDENQRRARAQQIQVFETPIAPRADHQERQQTQQHQPENRGNEISDRIAVEGVHYSGDHHGRRRDRQPHKILSIRFARIPRLRVFRDVKTRQTSGSAYQKEEREKSTRAVKLIENRRTQRAAHELYAPRISENGRCDSEADDIGQRIEFTA